MKTFTLQLIDDATKEIVVSHCQIGEDSLDAIRQFSQAMTMNMPAAGEKEDHERISPESIQQQSTTFKSS